MLSTSPRLQQRARKHRGRARDFLYVWTQFLRELDLRTYLHEVLHLSSHVPATALRVRTLQQNSRSEHIHCKCDFISQALPPSCVRMRNDFRFKK